MEDQVGPDLRLQTVGHQLAPQGLDQLTRRQRGTAGKAGDDLLLATRSQLQMAVLARGFQRGDRLRGRQPFLDEVEQGFVQSVDLVAQLGERLAK